VYLHAAHFAATYAASVGIPVRTSEVYLMMEQKTNCPASGAGLCSCVRVLEHMWCRFLTILQGGTRPLQYFKIMSDDFKIKLQKQFLTCALPHVFGAQAALLRSFTRLSYLRRWRSLLFTAHYVSIACALGPRVTLDSGVFRAVNAIDIWARAPSEFSSLTSVA